MSANVVHWDDVPARTREVGHLAGEWRGISDAAGSEYIGVRHVRLPPQKWATPVHVHTGEEEIFFIVGGSGLSWQGGKTYAVGEGDCIVHWPHGEPHSLRAGDSGLEFLVFGQRIYTELGQLPRAGVSWLGAAWVELGAEPIPWEREAAAGEPECPEPKRERPATIVNVADVEEFERETETIGRRVRDLGRTAESWRVGLKQYTALPQKLSVPPHCHSAEEELFVVLEGEGICLLGEDEIPVRRGSVVARPAGTGVPHTFRGGEAGLTYLAFGTREPNDICFYPRSGKVSFRGVKLIGRIERLDYWEGED